MNFDLNLKNDNYFKERRERLLHNQPFDVDKWCEFLKEETFETFVFSLSFEECEAMAVYYRVHLIHSKRFKFTEIHKKLLEEVELKMKKIMEENPNEDGFFVRLGTRSPKDAVLFDGQGLACCEKMKTLLEENFREIYITNNGKLEDEKDTIENKEYCGLMKAGCYSLSVNNSKDAMEMLLNSERVYTDNLLMLDFPLLYEKNPMKLVIRKWNKNLPYRNEFRCFVRNNKLNAVSQYDNYCYFPKLMKFKKKYSEIILEYFTNKISGIMKEYGYSNYTIDIGILRNNDKAIVIELNSFDEVEESSKCGTGSGCFSWRRDLKVLMNGPYEFRITEKTPFTKIEQQVAPDWMKFVYQTRRKILKEKEELDSSCIIL